MTELAEYKTNNRVAYITINRPEKRNAINDTLISHKFLSLGSKQIIVTPYFNGCAGVKDTVNIVIEGVIAGFSISNTCTNKNMKLTITSQWGIRINLLESILNNTAKQNNK